MIEQYVGSYNVEGAAVQWNHRSPDTILKISRFDKPKIKIKMFLLHHALVDLYCLNVNGSSHYPVDVDVMLPFRTLINIYFLKEISRDALCFFFSFGVQKSEKSACSLTLYVLLLMIKWKLYFN